MTAKEYLRRSFGAKEAIQSCREALWKIEQDRGIHAVLMGDRVSGGKTESHVELEAIRGIEAQEKLKKAISYWEKVLDETETAIESVRIPRYQTVLRYRYIVGLTWPAIAEQMDMDERSVLRLHGKALKWVKIE